MRSILSNIVLSIALGMASTATVNAQALKAQVLSDNHVMMRVPTDKKYILLPVEESQENDHISVIKDNNLVQYLNVRLAVNKADYYVPLDIQRFGKGNVVLDISVNRGDVANSASKSSTSDFAAWKLVKTSDKFDTTNREKFRPEFHHTPVYGWMNDPNGMFYKDGVLRPVLSVQSLWFTVGEHVLGTFYKYRPYSLEVRGRGNCSRCSGYNLQWLFGR